MKAVAHFKMGVVTPMLITAYQYAVTTGRAGCMETCSPGADEGCKTEKSCFYSLTFTDVPESRTL